MESSKDLKIQKLKNEKEDLWNLYKRLLESKIGKQGTQKDLIMQKVQEMYGEFTQLKKENERLRKENVKLKK